MNTQYVTAVKAELFGSDGTTSTVTGRRAEELFFRLTPYDEVPGPDEGSGVVNRRSSSRRGKVLTELGGRNEFEKDLQRMIVRSLADAEKSGRKRLMLIGDSIRMRIADATGYGPVAYRTLTEHFNLTHIPHNTGGTKSVVHFLDNWLTARPDVVHINAGLHDLATNPIRGGPADTHTPPETYQENVRTILHKLQESGVSDVVWASSTPVNEEWHKYVRGTQQLRTVWRTNADVAIYNELAREVAMEVGVMYNDIHAVVEELGIDSCILSDGVHLSRRGSQAIASQVTDVLAELR